MNTNTQPAEAPKNLREALKAKGRWWWVEDRLNALNEEMVADNAFIAGFKQGIFQLVLEWSARDKSLQYFGNRPAVNRMVDEYLEAKFALADGEPLADESGEADLPDDDFAEDDEE